MKTLELTPEKQKQNIIPKDRIKFVSKSWLILYFVYR